MAAWLARGNWGEVEEKHENCEQTSEEIPMLSHFFFHLAVFFPAYICSLVSFLILVTFPSTIVGNRNIQTVNLILIFYYFYLGNFACKKDDPAPNYICD